ncbi:ABC transporter ATP-binding protein [Paenibacillus thiaminolyticus]|nr:ABC transporter ATP-binding protein [Paenibacillus thiaminolyticus]
MFSLNRISVSAADGRRLLHEISCRVRRGEAIGVTGESGSGKTTLLKAAMGILGQGCVLEDGAIQLDGRDLHSLGPAERREMGGRAIGFIPQLPMTAFDPRLCMGSQMQAIFRTRLGLNRLDAAGLARAKLQQVHLPESDRVMASRPGALSGGMLQRVAIAILLGLNPPYIAADEPTSALDAENREAVIQLLHECKLSSGLLIVSHDIGVLSRICDQVLVLHDGVLVEQGKIEELLARPRHIWTSQLARSAARQEEGYWKWERYE